MEGEEFLYLYTYHRILVINMKKLLSGGFQTAPPDVTRLPVDKVIDFEEEKLPCGMGFFVDGSKLYMVGGEWVKEDPACKPCSILDMSKGNKGVSSCLYVADLSGPSVTFIHIHEFEAAKILPKVIKIDGRIYAMSSCMSYYGWVRRCASPSFESYCPSNYRESISLETPPFYEFYKKYSQSGVSGYARVGNDLCFEVGRECHYYNVTNGTWRLIPHHSSRLLSIIHRHGLGRNLCHGQFVVGCEDVLVSTHCRLIDPSIFPPSHYMEAFLLPPPGSNEDAPVFSQKFKEVDDDLCKIFESHGIIGEGLVLNLGKEKMCAIFPCNDDAKQFFLYIFIFQVSKLPPTEQQHPTKQAKRTKGPNICPEPTPKDFISVTCLHKGLYNLDEFGYDLPLTTGAFYMRKNSEVGGEVVCFQGFC